MGAIFEKKIYVGSAQKYCLDPFTKKKKKKTGIELTTCKII
jgi:hypothetical protein